MCNPLLITLPKNQPGKRNRDAIAIQAGACNPSGVARSLVQAIDEFTDSPDYTGTDSVRADPAIRLICHQLAFLLGVGEINWDQDTYSRLTKAVEAAVNPPAIQP